MSNKSQKTKNKAFTLVEMSIVLLILSLLFTSSIVLITSSLERNKALVTAKRMETIRNSLAIFLATNGRLPCPSSLQQTLYSASFGVEQISSGAQPATCTASGGLFAGISNGISTYMGAAPVRSLQLADEYMFDGWGNRITYIVQNPHINNGSNTFGVAVTNTNCANTAANSSSTANICYRGKASPSLAGGALNGLRVFDAQSNTITNDAVYVLISYGSNGNGAYVGNSGTGNAQRLSFPDSNANWSLEYENLNCNASTFSCAATTVNNIYVQAPTTQYFDDIVLFETRNNLLLNCNLYGVNACFSRFAINPG